MKEYLLLKDASMTSIQSHFSSVIHKRDLWLCGFDEISYAKKHYAIVVDGEIYNEQEIQEALHHALYPFAESIEELFVYAYLLWKEDLLQHMQGAYSFILLQDGCILAAKDPLGLAMMYYHYSDHCFAISNSIDILLKNTHIKPILDRKGLMNLFSFGPSIPEDQTLLKGIHQLAMGNYLTLTSSLHITKYYQLKAKKHTDTLEQTTQHVHHLVTSSITAQMKGAHASFLSGGLDSSIITAVCAKGNADWHTYSLEYEGNKENFKGNLYQVSLDDPYIKQMLQRYPCQHTTCMITQQELGDRLKDAMLARGFPGMADVDSSLLWLCEQVASNDALILSGECSDEIFGGYPWFYRDELKRLNTFPWLRSTDERIKLLRPSLKQLDMNGYIQQQYQDSIRDIDYLSSDSKEDRLARLHTNLCLHWFMQTLVVRQITMANMAGITIRAPFADVKTLEYVYNIPWKMKFYDQQEKGILRKAFTNELPNDVCWRKKNPYPKTHNPVYADMAAQLLKERFDDKSSPLHALFDKDMLQELINSKGASFHLPWYGQLMSGPQLLAYLYQIDCWICEYHIQIDLS